ncbi:segregation and condensation protein B [Candidatus Methanoperedens nitroreducens]|uniref:Segregation and condensation protein B n=1 Tax=Candidatus Methanoperedens nitratireducens TaxID=1392998 RepID=A0A062UWR8_9EURY|nr:SMC-Scp complex subunit ScpB [Candidatus Methanoperedens nitroreducens]KCZ71421.1 segregation and condensation protein B [Candidatus Methanoperedens nitroreducens]MDJ1421047.1 SMC-Scp complex subunit ScpB [Candidatus Methanoperedens sp.]
MSTGKEIIEAALFASGEPLDEGQLRGLIKGKNIRELVRQLMDEYTQRGSAIEIVEVEGKFVMQVRPEFADSVRSIAPKELRSPVLRTLSMIAYHQPLTVAKLTDRRGAAAYDHVRELEERGLISAVPQGRTRLLRTTARFAEYFNLDSADPEAIKRKIIELAREQRMGLDKWLGKQGIGVTPMYESLMQLCGISEYEVVNPYNPDDEERDRVQDLGVLVISKGYQEQVGEYFDGRIIEVSATTFDDVVNSINMLSGYGSKIKIKESIEQILGLKDDYIEKTYSITVKVAPQTEMIARIISELRLGISTDGVKIAPDYGTSSEGKEIGDGADILVPTHKNAERDVVKRICQRYDSVIEGLKKIKK